MKKTLLLSLIAVVFFAKSYGQSNLWNKVFDQRLEGVTKMDRASMPSKYQLYSLNLNALKNQLAAAPLDSSGQNSNVILSFPNPDGGFNRYAFYESPIMEKGLADQFPDIKTYCAFGIDNPTASMRISFTAFGLHAMTISGNSSSVYIDTYTRDLNYFIVYRKSDITASRLFECEFNDDSAKTIEDFTKRNMPLQRIDDSTFRTYRLAVACTGEYGLFHGGTVALAQAAIVTTVNRLNLVYQRDLAVRFVLVANNTSLLYTNGATDPFNNNNAGVLIGQSQTIITNTIGSANFDIGHTVSTGGGGLAGLGVICNDGNKARGITGSPAPVGDPFDIDYVAHEIGHQFGCNHTQNNNCQRNGATAVEPGSGSTIMGYAGICAPDVQGNSDDHFSFISIAEAKARIQSTSCPVSVPNGNFAPVVNAGLDYTIPLSTAFILTGVATDGNNDSLTYCWEQTNNEVSTQSPDPTSTNGPNFRSRIPTTSPQRFMPVLTSVIANNLTPTWEVVPSVERTMNFALTVRDNRTPNGGQTRRDDMVVTTANVGPFLVNTPNTAVSWVAGSNQTVTWSVAGTTANNINAAFVDILLSNDGGLTYPILLASKVPNDGSETITVPNNTGNTKRIMVRGYKHIFYDISNTNFTITAAPSTFSVAFSGVEEQQNKTACQGINVTYNISYLALGGFSATTTFTATGLPTGATATFAPSSITANGTVVMTIGNTSSSPSGFYTITVTATSGATTKTVPFYFGLFSSTFPAMILTSPANNSTNQSTSPTLLWEANANASSYDVQVSTDISFTNLISSGNVITPSYSVAGLAGNTNYFWRVLPKNPICGTSTFSTAFRFTTATPSCGTVNSANVPLEILATGAQTVISTLNIPSGGVISDVNVNVDITHTWISDLVLRITSPAGTIVTLVTNPCPGAGRNDIAATFDDSGTAFACSNFPGIGGVVLPAQSLTSFNGQNSTGTWTLTVVDQFNVDGGTINNWSLNICSTLSTTENTFQDLALYPNPNDGNFTVAFSTASNDDVAIDIYDMRGRLIYNNEFSNNGAFNQTIDLNSVQSGVYLVSISSGDAKMVKRIIVE
jgi:subtilisin-like proprotein convertase family protein